MRGRRGTHQARPDQGVAVLQGDLACGVRRRRSTARGHGDQAPTVAGPAGEAGGKESERREPQGAPRASDKAQAVTDEESGQGNNRRSWPLTEGPGRLRARTAWLRTKAKKKAPLLAGLSWLLEG